MGLADSRSIESLDHKNRSSDLATLGSRDHYERTGIFVGNRVSLRRNQSYNSLLNRLSGSDLWQLD